MTIDMERRASTVMVVAMSMEGQNCFWLERMRMEGHSNWMSKNRYWSYLEEKS